MNVTPLMKHFFCIQAHYFLGKIIMRGVFSGFGGGAVIILCLVCIHYIVGCISKNNSEERKYSKSTMEFTYIKHSILNNISYF